MRTSTVAVLLAAIFLCGCGAAGISSDDSAPPSSSSGGANLFNPYMHDSLPNLRTPSAEGQRMLAQLGGRVPRIEGEAAHRPHWREEVYPVVFGNARAADEILVLLDFAAPQSEKIWQAVTEASRSLSAQRCKIVVFGSSGEYYGTDLMGMAIWVSYSRSGQAMPYLSYALSAWNDVKARQTRAHGRARPFNNEYDATVESNEYPIHYTWFSRLRPPVPASQELALGRYCYDAGNVNMYQAEQIRRYYGVRALPAVVVNGRVLPSVTASAILKALS